MFPVLLLLLCVPVDATTTLEKANYCVLYSTVFNLEFEHCMSRVSDQFERHLCLTDLSNPAKLDPASCTETTELAHRYSVYARAYAAEEPWWPTPRYMTADTPSETFTVHLGKDKKVDQLEAKMAGMQDRHAAGAGCSLFEAALIHYHSYIPYPSYHSYILYHSYNSPYYSCHSYHSYKHHSCGHPYLLIQV